MSIRLQCFFVRIHKPYFFGSFLGISMVESKVLPVNVEHTFANVHLLFKKQRIFGSYFQ